VCARPIERVLSAQPSEGSVSAHTPGSPVLSAFPPIMKDMYGLLLVAASETSTATRTGAGSDPLGISLGIAALLVSILTAISQWRQAARQALLDERLVNVEEARDARRVRVRFWWHEEGDQRWVCVQALNEGYRPVELTRIIFITNGGAGFMPHVRHMSSGRRSMGDDSLFPIELTDGQSVTVCFDQADVDRLLCSGSPGPWFAAAEDTNGRVYMAAHSYSCEYGQDDR
jgi:hypothetical protein